MQGIKLMFVILISSMALATACGADDKKEDKYKWVYGDTLMEKTCAHLGGVEDYAFDSGNYEWIFRCTEDDVLRHVHYEKEIRVPR